MIRSAHWPPFLPRKGGRERSKKQRKREPAKSDPSIHSRGGVSLLFEGGGGVGRVGAAGGKTQIGQQGREWGRGGKSQKRGNDVHFSGKMPKKRFSIGQMMEEGETDPFGAPGEEAGKRGGRVKTI